ncbi:MAG: oligosaccharide flippase family protein [Bacteroidales bacterium]|nr:oligosaccharide flippase family protein [Bacteroidales bacterium]
MTWTSNDIGKFLQQLRVKGFFHLLSANVLIQVVAFASQLFVAGILAPDDLARIKIIQTYLAIFSILAGMGLNASTLKICSEGRSAGENRRYFNTAFFFTLLSSTVVYLILIIINNFNLLSSDRLIQALLPLGLFPLISNSLFMVLMAYFQAGKNIRLFSILTIINKLLSIGGIILLTWYMGIKGYYIAYNLSFLLMIVVAMMVSGGLFSRDLVTPELNLLKHHLQYSRSSVFSNIAAEASAYIDILLLSFLSKDLHELGYYSFALTLTIALRIFPSTVQQITLPYFSEKSKNRAGFTALFRRYNRLLFGVVAVSLLVFAGLVPLVLELLFNDKYASSVPYLYVLGTGWSIRSLVQLRSSALFGLGKIEYNGYTSLITLSFNLFCFPVLIYFWGLMGAAVATILSGIVINLSAGYYFRKALATTKWEE